MKHSAFLFVVALSVAAAAQTYTIIDVPGAAQTWPTAIGKNGGIVGRWDKGSFFRTGKGKYIKMPGKLSPMAINATGTMVGSSTGRAYQPGFIRSPQGVITLLYFGNYRTGVAGLNDAGIMFGTYQFVDQPDVAWTGTATNYIAVTMQDGTNIVPYAINTAGNVAGNYLNSDGTSHGVVWSSGSTTDFTVPGATGTLISTLDDLGYFAGEWWEGTLNEVNHCFVNDVNGLATIDPAGATQCYVTGRNKAGVTVGYYYDAENVSHGFRRGSKGVITTIDPPGSVGTEIIGVNASGKMVGYYYDGTAGHGFIYVP